MTTELALLKSPDYSAFAQVNGGHLPYRIDELAGAGFRLHYSDARYGRPWTHQRLSRVLSRLGPLGGPLVDTIAQWWWIRRSPVTLAMFECQGHVLAFTRSLFPWRRKG